MNDKVQGEGSEAKSYNDSELQDIMNEIESLEKEFVDQPASASMTSDSGPDLESLIIDSSQVKKTSLQDEIDKEISGIMQSNETPKQEEKIETHDVPVHDNVVSIPAMKPAEIHAETHSEIPVMEMNFHITGKMHLKYQVAMRDEIVHLTINEEGLFVELDNGAKFSMPLWHQEMKKKSA